VFLAWIILGMIMTGEYSTEMVSALVVPVVFLAFGTGFWLLTPRFTSKFDTPLRVTGFTLGVIALLIGIAWIPYEETYGVGTSYMIEEVENTGAVYVVDEMSGRQTLVFEGTVDEARRYVDEQGFDTANYTGPYVTIFLGAAVTLATAVLGWRRTADRSDGAH
jgi:hypothetical protein